MRSNFNDGIIDTVASLCPECGKPAMATIYDRNGKVYQRSECGCHESSGALIFSDTNFYRKLDEWNRLIFPAAEPAAVPLAGCGCNAAAGSQNDPCLAVIDITNRCNFKCPICFAEANAESNNYILDTELVRSMLQSLVDRPVPCRSIQFSGGEPTLHPEFPKILRIARDLGFTHIQAATNGSKFVDADYARLCEDSGLHTLYLQFDGMNDEVYLKMRGQRLLNKKIAAVKNIEQTNMRIVLVPTVMNSVNVDQLGPIFQFALEHSKFVTGISIQPVAYTGRVDLTNSGADPFNLAAMAREFGEQTGLTRFPDDWLPLSSLSLLCRAIDRMRSDTTIPPASDAHCSIGTFFYVDDNNKPFCLTSFFDFERFLRGMKDIKPYAEQGMIERQISKLRQFDQLSKCLDMKKAPSGLTFKRLLRSMDAWENKTEGRSEGWDRRGFNGIFVAGMHFMDAHSYNQRRLQRCIIQYVGTDGKLVPFCSYNSGARLREAEELVRIERSTQQGN
ncbi:MAG TPA: radical SAM protein [Acidobacteriaceae bacterium]